ncbi:hypothetical protein ACFLZX_02380 [Nanoarchaeota archaeon]
MKKTSSLLVGLMLVLSLVPVALADTPTTGGGVGIGIETEDFVPLIWMDDDSRVVRHNPADGSTLLVERIANYAFEGETIHWDVLVMDKNGIEKISDVYITIGTTQGEGNDIEANCDLGVFADGEDITRFNPFIDEERLTTLDADTMAIYDCTLSVETSASMYGEYWVVAEVEDLDGNLNTFDENEYWFFNPVIALSITGDIDFDVVRPGTLAYSDTLLVENDADDGSGVLLDMTISGTDFYDPASSGAKCPTMNRLRLNNGGAAPNYVLADADAWAVSQQEECTGYDPAVHDLSVETEVDFLCYYATNGAYHSGQDNTRDDIEGYVGIPYETGDENNRAPIISGDTNPDEFIFIGDDGGVIGQHSYFAGNVLTPGDEIAITFRIVLPEPCNGDFSDGQIYFWGTAI